MGSSANISRVWPVGLGCLALACALGCEKAQELVASAAEEQTAESADGVGPADEDEATRAELGSIISACLNDVAARVFRSRDRYLSWASAAGGPKAHRRTPIYGLYRAEVDPAGCAAAAERLRSTPPTNPAFDTAAGRYAAALGVAVERINEIEPYYSRENYRDDDLARGAAAHAPLVAALDAFRAAYREVSAEVERSEAALDARLLARLERSADGKLPFYVERARIRGRALTDAITKTSVAPDGALQDVDAAALVERTAEYEREVDEARAYDRAHAAERAGLGGVGAAQVEGLWDAAEALVTSTKAFARRARDGTRYSHSELDKLGTFAGWMVEGSPDRVVRDFNALIDVVNRM